MVEDCLSLTAFPFFRVAGIEEKIYTPHKKQLQDNKIKVICFAHITIVLNSKKKKMSPAQADFLAETGIRI